MFALFAPIGAQLAVERRRRCGTRYLDRSEDRGNGARLPERRSVDRGNDGAADRGGRRAGTFRCASRCGARSTWPKGAAVAPELFCVGGAARRSGRRAARHPRAGGGPRAPAPLSSGASPFGARASFVSLEQTRTVGELRERRRPRVQRDGPAALDERSDAAARAAASGGARYPARGRSPSATLTEREQQVADLIRRGARNREVASALQISEHTVERHVSSILGRLGLRSRWQIETRNSAQD